MKNIPIRILFIYHQFFLNNKELILTDKSIDKLVKNAAEFFKNCRTKL